MHFAGPNAVPDAPNEVEIGQPPPYFVPYNPSGTVATKLPTEAEILGASTTTVQTLRTPWTGSPVPVDRVARSACFSGTRRRKRTIRLVLPGDRPVSPAFTRCCHSPFVMQPAIALGPSRVHDKMSAEP